MTAVAGSKFALGADSSAALARIPGRVGGRMFLAAAGCVLALVLSAIAGAVATGTLGGGAALRRGRR